MNAPDQKRHVPFLQNVNLVFLAIVLSYLLSFLANVLVTRNLSADGRGFYALYITSITIGSSLLSLGYHNALLYFVGRGELSMRLAMAQVPLLVLLAGGVAALIGTAAAALARGALPVDGSVVALFVVGVMVTIAAVTLGALLMVLGRFGGMNLLTILRAGLFLVAVALGASLQALSFHTVIILWVVSQVLALVVAIALFGADSRFFFRPSLAGWHVLKRMLRFGLTGQAGNLAQLLNYRLDSYLVLAFVGSANVAYYAIATSVAEALWFLPTAISTVLLRRVTIDRGPESAPFTALVSRSTLFITCAGGIAVAIVAPFAVPMVFGPAYAAGVPAVYWLLPGVIAGSVMKVVSNYIFGAGRVTITAGISILALVVTVILDVALISRFGIVGAALASSASYLLSAALLLWFFQHLSGASIVTAVLPQPGDLAEARYQLRRACSVSPLLRRLV